MTGDEKVAVYGGWLRGELERESSSGGEEGKMCVVAAQAAVYGLG